jgi:flagellar protein FlgJ
MVAQAALETGWGRHEIRFEDGRTSHNLFGIRASANWKGPVAEIWTTEYVNGSPQRVRGQFRAYGSYEESFNDYARLISQNPRYANAMRNLGDPQAFAASLQQAGYATAPHYASVLSSVIQTAQRLQSEMPALAAAPGMRTASSAADASWRALNALSGGPAAPILGQRQWRQSPYAELDGPKALP